MARYKLQGRAVDTYGNVKPNEGVSIALAGTLTPAKIYLYATEAEFPDPIETFPQVTTDSYGRFAFWVDTEDYPVTQLFDVLAASLGYTDIDIFRGFKNHDEMLGLKADDHKQYGNLSQSETTSAAWTFLRVFTQSINPTGAYELTSKEYVDSLLTVVSGATIQYVDMRDEAVSAAAREKHNRQQEYIQLTNLSLSAASLEGDRTQKDYTDMRITSLSGATDENINRLYEYVDLENNTQTFQLSAASLEGDNRLQENIDTLDTRVTNVSAASREQDKRVREYAATITGVSSAATIQYVDNQNNLQTASLSAASLEGDRTQKDYTDSEIAIVDSAIIAIGDYFDSRVVSVSASSREQDQRLYEYADEVYINATDTAILYTDTITDWVSASSREQDRRLSENITTLDTRVTNVSAASREQDRRLSENITTLELINEDTKEPTGFLNRTDSVHYNDTSTHTLYLSGANGGTFDIYIKGIKYTKSIVSAQYTDVDGLHYFYFDGNGDFQHTTVFSSQIITDWAFAHIMYWDADDQKVVLCGDERHGAVMDGITHWYLHSTRGTVWESGLGITGIDADQDGSSDLHAYLEINGGVIWDEDIRHSIETLPPTATSHILYIENNKWKITEDTLFPVRNYSGGSGLVAWNNVSGSGMQVEAASGSYVLAHIYAINDYHYPIVGIQGQAEYMTLEDARLGATTEINNLVTDTLPFVEFVPVGSIIYQTSPSFTNSVKARIVSTDEGLDYVDFRAVRGAPTGAISTNDHSNLSGLNGDDHLQYANLNGSRNFTGTVGGITPVADADLTTKLYVDTITDSLSAASLEGDRSLWDGIDEATDTAVLYTDFVTNSLSAASREQDQRLYEYADEVYINATDTAILYTDTMTDWISASSREQDRRLQENIDTLDIRVTNVSAASQEQDNRIYQLGIDYTDTRITSISAASDEADQRIYEYGAANWAGGGGGISLPSGGVANDVLVKQSGVDGDADWTYNIDDNASNSTTLWSAQQILETLSVSASIVLYGDGDPSSALGGAKNYYIDSLTGNIWKKDTLGYSADLTGSGTPSGGVTPSFGSSYSDLVDNNLDATNSTVFMQSSIASTRWYSYEFTSPKTITRIAIYPRDGYIERQPAGIQIYGSQNGQFTDEVLIDTITLGTWSTAEWRYFPFTNTTSYLAYKFKGTTSPAGNYWDTAEIELHEVSNYSWGIVWDNETFTNSLSAASLEGDRTQQDYTDTQIVSVSAASKEADQRIYEYGDENWLSTGSGLPSGGNIGQVLSKTTSADGGADWTDLSTLLAGEFEWCYVRKASATETVNNASPGPTVIEWDADIRIDSSFVHSTSTHSERISATETGHYLLNVALVWDCGTTDRTIPYIEVYKNGSVFTQTEARSYGYLRGAAYNDQVDTNLTTVIPLSAGDYIDVRGTQEYSDGTNGATTLVANAYLKMVKLTPTKGDTGDTGPTGPTGATGQDGTDGIVTFGSAPSGAYADFQSDYTKIYAPTLYLGTSGGYFEEGETNPSGSVPLGYNGYLYATRVYNAVYNDIADFQLLDDKLVYGKCYYRGPNGMKICNEKMKKGVVGIASDTYGYGLGSRKDGVPLAVGGWVLAYVDGKVENGDPLTTNEVGNLCKMEMWEKVFYPERIVAIYQYKEQEENWNNIIVNGRHWVKIN